MTNQSKSLYIFYDIKINNHILNYPEFIFQLLIFDLLILGRSQS